MPKEDFKREVEKELTGKGNGTVGDYLLKPGIRQVAKIRQIRAVKVRYFKIGSEFS